MTFQFDMHHVGQTIAQLRREHNMTQMQLADEVGVSFQAVSNWERGQSMPDISKLPELAALFDTTIDALLGRHSPLIEKAAEGRLDEPPVPTVAEVAGAAPLLPPRQMDQLTDQLLALPDLPDMTELLPFLPTAKVDELLRQSAAAGGDLATYAVFASTAAVDEAACTLEQQGQVTSLLPFMSQKAIDALAQARQTSGEDLHDLLPFLSTAALNSIVLARLQHGEGISDLLPFLSQDTLLRLFEGTSSKD